MKCLSRMIIGVLTFPSDISSPIREMVGRLGAQAILSRDPEVLSIADGVILSGTGDPVEAMRSMETLHCSEWLRGMKQPVLGVNMGMQVLFEKRELDDEPLLGIMPGILTSFQACKCMSPNIGWHSLTIKREHSLLAGIKDEDLFYFLHTEFTAESPNSLATTTCENTFSAAVAYENFMGIQFSPEKSGRAGSLVIQNFLNIVRQERRQWPS